jgi:succinate dehydrogenase hydrophobic anchor subunit
MSSLRTTRPIGGFDGFMWLFTRFSGLALMLFGAFSLGASFIFGGRQYVDLPTTFRWMFFPNPNHVIGSNIPSIEPNWTNAFWDIYAILMIGLASVHAFNGLRMIIEDYVENPLIIRMLQFTVIVLSIGSIILASVVINNR